jgi:quercetin dioxygenase-like cupin family protein
MDAFTVSDAAAEIADGDESIEKLRTDAVSLEIMTFEEGDEDPMHAHAEDEIYHIDSGHAQLNVEGETRKVSEGDAIHLEPGTDHQFLSFEDELVMTVLYAPAKGSTE